MVLLYVTLRYVMVCYNVEFMVERKKKRKYI